MSLKALCQPQRGMQARRGAFTRLSDMFGKRSEFKKEQAKFGKDRDDSYRAEYEKELQERTKNKMNWGIKNRWEQRALDDIIKNADVRNVKFRDYAKIKQQQAAFLVSGRDLREFNSVDEIYYFMENMFTEGFSEEHISIALDIFIRDAGFFEDKDLESPTFKSFLRELGQNLITFADEKSYVKTAKFLDIFCIDDKFLWINLEMYIIKKERMFSTKAYVELMSHFSSQHEGTRDFYDFYEFNYMSKVFAKLNTHDLISLGYNFYQVHAGTINFFNSYCEDLIERLDDKTTTFDLLRVLQTFSEISTRFPKLFT